MRTVILIKDFEVSAIGIGCMGMIYGFRKPFNQNEMIEFV